MRLPFICVVWCLAACAGEDKADDSASGAEGGGGEGGGDDTDADDTDADGDGSPASEDCDDGDAAVYPGATEICLDGIDNDCDGAGDPGRGRPCALSAADASAVLLAEGALDKAGYSLAPLGDLDGDGADDLLVGARFGAGVGTAYVVAGPITGTLDLSASVAILRGEAELDEFAGRVTEAGDPSGDGVPDLLLGAMGIDEGGEQSGGVYLFFGPITGEHTWRDADGARSGEAAQDFAGDAVAAAGDVSGDGVSDFVVGASNASPGVESAGVVYLVLGPGTGAGSLADAEARLVGDGAYDTAGNAVIGLGDADGDGVPDIAAGAPHRDGRGEVIEGYAAVFLGPVSGTQPLTDGDGVHWGEEAGHRAGADVAGGVDADGDGLPDLAVGAHSWGAGEEGAAYVVTDPAGGATSLADAWLRVEGDGETGWLGVRLDFVGDLDGDGADELCVGAKFHDGPAEDAGMAYVFFGPLTGGTRTVAEADLTISGAATADEFGMDIAAGGDLTGDGLDDLAVGAQGESTRGEDAGAAYVISLGGG